MFRWKKKEPESALRSGRVLSLALATAAALLAIITSVFYVLYVDCREIGAVFRYPHNNVTSVFLEMVLWRPCRLVDV